ncbi:hypothetical protein ROR02_06390 [Pararhodospirillum oryzae]|uniref:Uncharacterized protein n=1 Tax=Pararhodospirillum oryzae TaxID=478448 RepID=A0A512H504_9PROT|nr:hypothetical protein ROR02_06390 [Pararhodospirillum oryzae]
MPSGLISIGADGSLGAEASSSRYSEAMACDMGKDPPNGTRILRDRILRMDKDPPRQDPPNGQGSSEWARILLEGGNALAPREPTGLPQRRGGWKEALQGSFLTRAPLPIF